MPRKHQRPPVATGGVDAGAETLPFTADPTTSSGPADTGPVEPAGPVPVRDKLRWTWDDIEALTGYDRRWMQQEISAGRMPRADLRAGRRAGWRPSTILGWLDAMADRQGRRSGR